ncbi:MAG: SDR family oxidoreductase [Chloroflexi bacterium]|nr:SDR family oxidoreductase [Chloroflexota bacterium]
MSFRDKVALVTGATGGLGPSVTQAFVEAGAHVVAVSRTSAALEALRRQAGQRSNELTLLVGDVTNATEVERVVAQTLERPGRIDVLVNLVGGWASASVASATEELWDRMMTLNLKSAFLCCHAVIPHMIQQNYGRIVSVSAQPALKAGARTSAYAAAKAGVLRLTESLSEEVKRYEITVNAILPSIIDTEANRQSMPNADHSLWVKPEEIAKVILFLASDDARIISGAAIPVFGRA